jgi:predicted PurR-regulated permease PerM
MTPSDPKDPNAPSDPNAPVPPAASPPTSTPASAAAPASPPSAPASTVTTASFSAIPAMPSDPSGGGTGPVSSRGLSGLIQQGGPVRRFLSRWGFPLFVLLVLILGRHVLLPFVFAGLIAYILAPVVRAMAERPDGSRRIPRGLAIVVCYIIFIAAIVGFLFLLVPRLSKDIGRIGAEAPELIKKVNEEWAPEAGRWLEKRIKPIEKPVIVEPPIVADVPLPPGTAFTMTPLPDGRFALSMTPSGIQVRALPSGGYHLQTEEKPPEPATMEDKIRALAAKGLAGLQSRLDDAVRVGQRLVAGIIKGVFTFFLTLMIGAFILIDMEKVHAFLRSLFPPNVRDDYDVIIQGIDRGLSGVIRGQLLICLINGLLTYLGLIIFDVKYSLILGVVAGVMSLIPIFGSILSTVPIVLSALVSGEHGLDIFRSVAMTVWIVAIHFIEANLLNPKIIGTAAKIHPVLVIFSLILGEHSYGLVGALLAVPVLSTIQVVFVFLYRKAWKDLPRRGGADSGPISGIYAATGPLPRIDTGPHPRP